MNWKSVGRRRENKDSGSRLRDIAKYTGLAFQMGFIILLGTLAGKYLDRHFQLQKPVFTLILSLVSVFAALYISLKDFLFKGK
jgi:hypothetical protein